MNKRGQIVIFVLIGIVILIALGFILYIQESASDDIRKDEIAELPLQIQPVKTYVESCIESIGPIGLYLIGVQGGFIEPFPIALKTHYSQIAYGYYEGVKTLVSLQAIGQEFSEYIQTELPPCINNFEALQGYDITAGEIKGETVFTEDETIINLKYPLTISREGSRTTMSDFSVAFPVRLRKIHGVVDTIVNKEAEAPNSIDITYLKESGFDIAIVPINLDTILYIMSDNKSKITGAPYIFMFANKFKLSDIRGSLTGHEPVLQFIPDFKVLVGQEMTYQVIADDVDNDNLQFYVYSTLDIEINETGYINFTPVEGDIGTSFLRIDVEDGTGLSDSKIVAVEVLADE
jgi:hypothetical protein